MILDILALPDGRELSSGSEAEVTIRQLSYTAQVNAAQELDFGCACAASVQVQLLDTTGSFTLRSGTRLIHYRTDGENRVKMGTFYVSHPTRPSPNLLSFTAYDAMLRADVELTGWLAGLQGWPYPMATLLSMVCEKCGLELGEIDLPNGEHPVLQFARQVTGRQLIAWIAGANARFASIDPQGRLTLTPLTENGTPITATDLKQQKLEAFVTNPIQAVAIRSQSDDLGITWPEGAREIYTITANPMLAALSYEALEAPAQRLADELVGVSYTPGSVTAFCHSPELPWKPGQAVTVGNAKMLVFSMTVRGETVTLESAGQLSRSSADARYSRDKVALLQGQMTQVQLDMEGLQLQVSRVEAMEVGGRNLIRQSQSLHHDSYYFESGAALSDTATAQGQVVKITDAAQGSELQVQLPENSTVWLWGKNLLEDELTGTYAAVGAREWGEFKPPMGFREHTRYALSLTYTAENMAYSAGGNLLYAAVYYTDGTANFTGGITDKNHHTGQLHVITQEGLTVQRITLVSHARWTGGTITVHTAQLELGSAPTDYAPFAGAQWALADETGYAAGLRAIAPEMTLAAMTKEELTVTYRRTAALEQVIEDREFPRFNIRTLPECFVLPGLMNPGQIYTLSFQGRGGALEISGNPMELTDSWQDYVLTFIPESADLRLTFGREGVYDLYRLQLEQGTVATDYRPAPEDTQQQIFQTREQIAQLQVGADRIGAQLTQLETTTNAAMDLTALEVSRLKEQVGLTMSAQQVELTVQKAVSQGAEKVVTGAGYTFDDRGLTISGLRSEMENFIDHSGMQVRRAGQVILRADAQGVTARDVQVHNYLVVGDHARLEDYTTPTDPHRTACYWL